MKLKLNRGQPGVLSPLSPAERTAWAHVSFLTGSGFLCYYVPFILKKKKKKKTWQALTIKYHKIVYQVQSELEFGKISYVDLKKVIHVILLGKTRQRVHIDDSADVESRV